MPLKNQSLPSERCKRGRIEGSILKIFSFPDIFRVICSYLGSLDAHHLYLTKKTIKPLVDEAQFCANFEAPSNFHGRDGRESIYKLSLKKFNYHSFQITYPIKVKMVPHVEKVAAHSYDGDAQDKNGDVLLYSRLNLNDSFPESLEPTNPMYIFLQNYIDHPSTSSNLPNYEDEMNIAPQTESEIDKPHDLVESSIYTDRYSIQQLQDWNKALSAALEKNRNITSFTIANAHFDIEGFKLICKCLESKQGLRRISISSFGNSCTIHRDALLAFCKILFNNIHLKDIGIKSIGIESDESARLILQILSFHRHIEQFSLIREPITKKVGELLSKLLNTNRIQSLRILPSSYSSEGCDTIFKTLRTRDVVSKLLFGGQIQKSFGASFCKYLKVTKSLKLLHIIFLSNNSFQDAFMKGIRENTSLTTLRIQISNFESQEMILAMIDSIKGHSQLQTLILDGVLLSNKLLQTFSAIMKDKSTIKSIIFLNPPSLQKNADIEVGLREFKNAVLHNENFEKFFIPPQFITPGELKIAKNISRGKLRNH